MTTVVLDAPQPVRASDPRRDVIHSVCLAAALTIASYLVGFACGWIRAVDPLEAIAVATSYSCTYLCVKQRRINYVVGAVSTAAYCLLFWRQGLYASMALNAYLTPALVYGWIRWRTDADPRPVTRLRPVWASAYLGVAALALLGALVLNGALGGSFAVTDSLILVGSVLAQLLMDNKLVENWVVWFAVDLLAVWEYVSSGLAVAGVQYGLFLVNAVWGLVAWRRSMREATR